MNPDIIDQELERVLGSPDFSGTTRLKEFLAYIVAETCSGRGGLILGKTIAQEFYGRGADVDGRGLSLDKVDAGRLRRLLDEYYSGSGAQNPMRITIPRGGYLPRSENSGPAMSKTENASYFLTNFRQSVLGSKRVSAFVAVFGASLLIAICWWGTTGLANPGADTRAIAERQALRAKSPTALQAVNLAKQARVLIFPPTDPKRLQATLDMFNRALELDFTYFGGYAGSAQVVGLQAPSAHRVWRVMH